MGGIHIGRRALPYQYPGQEADRPHARCRLVQPPDRSFSNGAPYLGRLERIQALSELLSDRYGTLRIRAIGAACRRAAMVCPTRRLAFQSGQSCLSSCALLGLRHAPHARAIPQYDRKSVGLGKSVSVRVDLGGSRIIKKKTKNKYTRTAT